MVYLIYNCFEDKSSVSESIIAGSLMLDTAETEEQAQQKVEMYKGRSEEFYKSFPILKSGTSRIIYIYWPHPLQSPI